MLDLDAIQTRVPEDEPPQPDLDTLGWRHQYWEDVPALVAELRAARDELYVARDVIPAARLLANTTGFAAPEVHAERRAELLRRLAAYDQLIKETPQ